MQRVTSGLEALWQSRVFHRWIIPLLIFLVAFFPRLIYPVSRSGQWFARSFVFIDAILDVNPEGTFLRYHPGVSLMWLSGPALKIASLMTKDFSMDRVLGRAPIRAGVLNDLTWSGVLPLALVISLCIALVYPLLNRLAGRRIAIAAALFMALDPFLIAYSKVIHLDALLAMFMIVSALFLLNYLKEASKQNLILSGVFAGLAFLTKSPSYFLIPYAGLVVTVASVGRFLQETTGRQARDWLRLTFTIARALLVWAAIAGLTFVVLFPAMWVMPGEILREIYRSIFLHVSVPHKNPVYFAGRLWIGEDPGTPFYLAVIGWKTTILTLPLIVAAVFFGLSNIRSPRARILWSIIAYSFFFTLQMGIGDKKQMGYIMPTFPALSIMAAFGLVWTVEVVARQRQWLQVALASLIIVLQAVLVLRTHPYYGTHHNILLGGSETAVRMLPIQDQGEGLDLAARYLNELPFGETSKAAVYNRNGRIFNREFNGTTVVTYDPEADFRVYDLNSVLRNFSYDEDWYQGWRSEQQDEPLHTIAFDGVTYVWIYGDQPADPTNGGPTYDVNYRIGEQIYLEEYQINNSSFQPGDELVVVYVWHPKGLVDGHYKVFTHVTAADGQPVAQADAIPLSSIRPTFTWGKDEVLQDAYYIYLDNAIPQGEYELSVGMYDIYTLERIPVYDSRGNRVPEDRIILGTIQVDPSE